MSMTKAPDWPFIQHPDHGIFGGVLMSNCDHSVNAAVAERMKSEQVLAKYPGWNFHAVCWYADGLYHAEVSVLGVHRTTVSAFTPEDVMREVSSAFGQD